MDLEAMRHHEHYMQDVGSEPSNEYDIKSLKKSEEKQNHYTLIPGLLTLLIPPIS
jgi:hypothetical protein